VFNKNLLILFAAGLLFWTSMTSQLPVLPAYINDLGGTTQQVGWVMGCFAIGLLFSRTWVGSLADRHSRKIVLLIGTAVAGIAPVGYYFVSSIPLLMVLRAFHGISIASFTTGYSTLVIDFAPDKQRGELIGYMTLAVPIGMSVGPALGGLLQETYGYGTLFLVSSGCGFFALSLGSLVGEKRREGLGRDTAVEPHRSIWEMLRSPSLMVPTGILLSIGLLFGTLVAFLPLFLRESGVDFSAGLFYTAAALASFSLRIFVGKISDKIGRGLFITGSLICYGISMVILASTQTSNGFLLAAILEGMGSGLLIPMMLALMSDRSYTNERGRVTSFCIGGFELGIALGGPILGSITFLTYRHRFYIAAGFALIGLVLFLTRSGKSLGRSLRFALGRSKDSYQLPVTSDQ